MIEIKRYDAEDKKQWDDFVKQSRSGVFLFLRDYMEYHSDRFQDYSLLFFSKDELVGLMPANIHDHSIYSHNGLTFGGMVTNRSLGTIRMLQIFKSLLEYLKDDGVKELFYKAVPHIFHQYPSQEDLYALFINGAKLVGREASSAIKISDRIPFNRNRARSVKKAMDNGVEIKRSNRFGEFMELKREQLMRKYGIQPTHTPEEMEYLASKFPDNIKFYAAKNEGEMIDGAIIYESENVAHIQYLGSIKEGFTYRASDLVVDQLINQFYPDKKYLNFGVSTEDKGQYLNQGLITFKERFGARTVIQDTYELNIS